MNASSQVVDEARANVGAAVIGRNMFGPPGGGEWGDEPWNGWWGDDPPYHYDVFVVTHHPREPLEMEGGTTFHFVTDGIEQALERAKESAGGEDVMLWGGARLFDNLGAAEIQLEQVRAVEAPGVTHIKYRVKT